MISHGHGKTENDEWKPKAIIEMCKKRSFKLDKTVKKCAYFHERYNYLIFFKYISINFELNKPLK
jgi:hypothetical protein